jgi:transcription antitermination factor NusG
LVDAQTVGVLVTAASVTVAAIYYVLTLRTNQRNIKANLETRQTQLFMLSLFDRLSSPEASERARKEKVLVRLLD